ELSIGRGDSVRQYDDCDGGLRTQRRIRNRPSSRPANAATMPVLIREGDMRRREFIGGVGAAAVVGPRGAWGQQRAMPVIGFLNGSVPTTMASALTVFRAGLKQTDFTEGSNVAIHYRWAEGDYQRLPAMAEELVARQ